MLSNHISLQYINLTFNLLFSLVFHKVRLGIITYSNEAKMEFYLNTFTDKMAVHNAMRLPHRGGRTNAQEALRLMHTEVFTAINGDRTGVKNIGVFVSDGYSNMEEQNTVPEAHRVKDKNIEMYAVALGESPNLKELNEIVSAPESTHIFRLKDEQQVMASALQLVNQLCV